MDDKSFKLIIKSENSASFYLKKRCWKNYRRFCVRCRSYRLYKLSNKKYRCKRCGYTFHDFSGRWISKCRIGSRDWLRVVRWFEKGFSARQMSKMVDLSYPTILKSLDVLRLSIIANQADSRSWLDLVYFGPAEHLEQENKHPILFGIIESGHEVRIDILGRLPVEILSGLKPRMLYRSSIYYTDEYTPYSFLLFHDHKKIHDSQGDAWRQKSGFHHESNFLKFARRRIIPHHGIAEKKFPQVLKEIEFRYRNRNRPIFEQLCRFLVSFIPRR